LKIREAFELSYLPEFSNTHDLALSSSSHFCAAVSFLFQSQDSHPMPFTGIRGPEGEGTFLSVTAGSRPSSLTL